MGASSATRERRVAMTEHALLGPWVRRLPARTPRRRAQPRGQHPAELPRHLAAALALCRPQRPQGDRPAPGRGPLGRPGSGLPGRTGREAGLWRGDAQPASGGHPLPGALRRRAQPGARPVVRGNPFHLVQESAPAPGELPGEGGNGRPVGGGGAGVRPRAGGIMPCCYSFTTPGRAPTRWPMSR